MSEFDKARRVLQNTTPVFHKPSAAQHLLLSGESALQGTLLRSIVQSQSGGKIVLTRDCPDAFWRTFVSDPRAVIIRNAPDTRTYHPFSGHSDAEIRKMLEALPGAENASAELRLLIRAIAQLLTVDDNLIEFIAANGCDAEVLDERLAWLLAHGQLDPARHRALQRSLGAYSNAYPALEALFCDLTDFAALMTGTSRLRVVNTLRSCMARGQTLIFVFDNDYRSSSGFDKMLLSLLASDLEFTLKNRGPFTLLIDDLPWLYVRPFEWVFSQSDASCVIDLRTAADYHTNRAYSQLVRSAFDLCLIFTHSNQDMCRFWSDSFGTARIIEYTYGSTDTITSRYPMLGSVSALFGPQQRSDSLSYHYVDKNLHPDYEIRDLGPRDCFIYDKGAGRIVQRALSL